MYVLRMSISHIDMHRYHIFILAGSGLFIGFSFKLAIVYCFLDFVWVIVAETCECHLQLVQGWCTPAISRCSHCSRLVKCRACNIQM